MLMRAPSTARAAGHTRDASASSARPPTPRSCAQSLRTTALRNASARTRRVAPQSASGAPARAPGRARPAPVFHRAARAPQWLRPCPRAADTDEAIAEDQEEPARKLGRFPAGRQLIERPDQRVLN